MIHPQDLVVIVFGAMTFLGLLAWQHGEGGCKECPHCQGLKRERAQKEHEHQHQVYGRCQDPRCPRNTWRPR